MSSPVKSVIIVGGGFAGLAAGIYARMNGYNTQIFEMHDLPGGLCTSWKRKGYTVDACIHWLVGSNPQSRMFNYWEEVGIARNRKFIDMDEYMQVENEAGRRIIFYTNVDRLEKHLLEIAPEDAEPIKEFIKGIKMCIPFDQPSQKIPLPLRIGKQLSLGFSFMKNGKKMQEWMRITCEEFAGRFKNNLLRNALMEMWIPEFSMFFMLFTFAYLHNRNAGYPLGGSLPMSMAMEERYKELGGVIHYRKRVKSIITKNDIATGIILSDGTEYSGDIVISAADGFNTIFSMLEGRYADEKLRRIYEKWPVFPPLIFIGLGINRRFDEIPVSVSGFSFALKEPVMLSGKIRERLTVHIYNHDPSMSPEGRTTLTLMLKADYEYWKKLIEDRKEYERNKEEIATRIIELLEQRFPGIKDQVEMVNVATPMTFERFTGNWKGSFEGWLITPENASVLMKPMSQSLPGLKGFYMCGQWVEPGGGLPTSVMSARRLIKRICKEDGKRFKTFTK
jgi:phytoene dehydrogenase-like protein